MKKRKIIKIISLVVLGLGVLGGVIALTSHFIKKDEMTIHPTFEVGGLNANGKYEEDNTTLYTKEKFACDGLKVTLAFDATIDYQIFYYDIVDNFVSSTEVLSEGYNEVVPINCPYARIKIIPTNNEDDKISWTEKIKYANQLEIKVAKNANKIEDKFVNLNGNTFQIVNNIEESVFVNGVAFNDDLSIKVHPQFSATTETILFTANYKTLKFDISKLDVTDSTNIVIGLYEFSEKPTSSSKFTLTQYARSEFEDKIITLQKNTNYVLISMYCTNETVISSNYSKFAKCFSLTK